ncbi:hypothetical protein ACFCX4_26330 [Kitasatospora sp. NPDC056327]|uniref:hypothetical protein n=1 Tax=Kitasatospora sp. NPDC056327 TaxID=3345785 RepID=UPI0035DC7009
MLRMNGPLRITVLDKDAYYEQRAVVRTPYGTFVLEGRIGASLDVRADDWDLELQHCVPGVGWRPNVRVLPYPWQTSRGGTRSRIVRSKDCDWPNGDPTERNFILRLSGTVAQREEERASTTDAVGPATRGGVRTSSGAGVGTSAGGPAGTSAGTWADAPSGARVGTAAEPPAEVGTGRTAVSAPVPATAVPTATAAGAAPASVSRSASVLVPGVLRGTAAVPGAPLAAAVPAHGGAPGYGAGAPHGTLPSVPGEAPAAALRARAAAPGGYADAVPAVVSGVPLGRVLPESAGRPATSASPERRPGSSTPCSRWATRWGWGWSRWSSSAR